MSGDLAKPAAVLFSHLTPTGLKPLPRAWTWEEDRTFGLALAGVGKALPWSLADFMLYAEKKHGEKAPQLYEETGLGDARTGVNYLRTAERFPPARRRAGVPFSLHTDLASLPPEEQDAWLDRIEREGLTRAQLRAALGKTKALEEPEHTVHRCRCGVTWEGEGEDAGEVEPEEDG